MITVCDLCLLFVVWRFYDDVFERMENRKKLRCFTGIIWFLATHLVSESFHSVALNLITLVVSGFILLIPYKGTIFQKITANILVICVLSACDYISCMLFLASSGTKDVYVICYVGIVVMTMICEILLRRFMIRNKWKTIRNRDASILLIIPIAVIIILLCVYKSGVSEAGSLITGMCSLIISLVSFYLYDVVAAKLEKESLDIQVEAYKRELDKIQQNELRIEGIRHDLRHHIIEIENMVNEGDKKGVKDYLNSIRKDMDIDKRSSNTGVYEIDSLINYMIEEAGSKLDNVELDISVPDNIDIEKYNLNVILGNLLENAIEAAEKSDKKWLSLTMKLEKNMLFMEICNSYPGTIKADHDRLLSTKTNSKGHGLGISNAERMVKESGGEISHSIENEIFSVRVMIYL